ncbi:MAG: baseplate J/gp47 family protein [Polyangiaceae bacterium]|nr:baseplate J/gp47 family protein [Polyangiaceae bacterium]
MTTLSDLLSEQRKEPVLQALLSLMGALELPVTAWQEGNPLRLVADAVSEIYADSSEAVSGIVRGGFLGLAEGAWLTLLARHNYEVERKPATYARVTAILTAAPASGPHTIGQGDLWASTADGRRFVNVTGGTLGVGGTMALEWQAETAGPGHNVADHTVTTLVTQLAGVAVANPGPDSLTEAGVDAESDARLTERCRQQWGTLGIPTGAGLVAWAIEASLGVTRAWVDAQNPDGPGTVRVYCANDDGAALAGAVAAVQAFYDAGRTPVSAVYTALPAVERVVPVVAVVYAHSATAPTVLACATAVETYFRALPIGGDVIPALAPARLFRDQIELALLALPGVITVNLVAPAADVALLDHEVATPTLSISVVTV